MTNARELAQNARAASRKLQAMTTDERVAMLNRVADALVANEQIIMEENAKVRADASEPVPSHQGSTCEPG